MLMNVDVQAAVLVQL